MKRMAAKPAVFVGSSTEGLGIASQVQRHLSDVAEVTVWPDGIFDLNHAALDALLTALERFDFAVLVLSPDDILHSRGVEHQSARDNVLFELGLFLGHFGRSRTFALCHPEAKIPSDLAGITLAMIEKRTDRNMTAATRVACATIADKIREYRSRIGAVQDDHRHLQVFRNVEELGFVEHVTGLVDRSSEITFIGTGLNILHQSSIRELIVRRAREGVLDATICFGNPFSPHVRERLVEEELCEARPEVAADGIIKRVQSLLKMTTGVPNIRVKLFNNYPTMSIFRFDDARFVYYPMGYRKLGNRCPAMVVERPSIYAEFLDEMIDFYLEDAVDAREVFRVKVDHQRTKDFLAPDNIRAVAVYAIPDLDSDFYRHGAELLGYDVLRRYEVEGQEDARRFRQFVGGAKAYGFHVTVADLMYIEANQVRTLACEVREIARSIQRFELAIDGIAEGEFGEHSVVLTCSEATGQFERLVAEVTVRIRPHALGTNYTLDRTMASRHGPLTPRDWTMVETYQSPYVFGGFRPHFTLATPPTPPDPSDRQEMLRTIRARFGSYLGESRYVAVDRLYLLERRLDEGCWSSVHEIQLR